MDKEKDTSTFLTAMGENNLGLKDYKHMVIERETGFNILEVR